MKKNMALTVAAVLACSSWAVAQSTEGSRSEGQTFQIQAPIFSSDKGSPEPRATTEAVAPCPSPACAPDTCSALDGCCNADHRGPRYWVSAEALIFWERSAPLPPLVTTNPNATTDIGALNEPATRVIFGGSAGNQNFDTFAGIRATVGGWFTEDEIVGAELSGFVLGRNGTSFSASSAGGFAPIVSIPFNATVPFNLNPAGETSLNAGNVPNTVTVTGTSQLWGAEANNLFKLASGQNYRVAFLAGVRFIELDESIGIYDTFNDTTTSGTAAVSDAFHTRNQFYGAQIGLHGLTTMGNLSVEATAKIAFGVDYEISDIAGSTVVTNGAFGLPTGTNQGGIFAEPSNIGRHTQSPFAVAPEFEFKLGYDVTSHVQVSLGYDFLYISDVLRPGAQIDRNINPTQNVVFGGTGGVLNGPAAPLGSTSSSDFWAQGITVGLNLRY